MQRGPASSKPDDPDEMSKLAARLFRTRDGRVWLEQMGVRLFDHPLGPQPSEAVLRYHEAQRDLIREIRLYIARDEKTQK